MRPAFLVAGMQDGELKRRLLSCQDDLVRRTNFSIAHRGAPAAIPRAHEMYLALDALAQQVGVIGVFSDWPGTVSYYASCLGLE